MVRAPMSLLLLKCYVCAVGGMLFASNNESPMDQDQPQAPLRDTQHPSCIFAPIGEHLNPSLS